MARKAKIQNSKNKIYGVEMGTSISTHLSANLNPRTNYLFLNSVCFSKRDYVCANEVNMAGVI